MQQDVEGEPRKITSKQQKKSHRVKRILYADHYLSLYCLPPLIVFVLYAQHCVSRPCFSRSSHTHWSLMDRSIREIYT
uniref:Uncharacterized protein n=1 Tax=Daphnia magna TaxID=35525 RepID=A0A0P5JW51_9CRUS